ncbi:MAG: hypothetical protein RMK29_14365 [Myxococcales bacterium]|nr:hypothetical protein [Myxococcales bacterium]
MRTLLLAVPAVLLTLPACGPAAGTLELAIYGESYVEEGIPAADVHDGWGVKFATFLIAVGPVSAARGHGQPDLEDNTVRVFNLARPSGGQGHLVLSAMVPGGTYDHVAYRVAPPPASAQMGNATAAERDLLVQRGHSIYVEGTATKERTTKRFRWGFSTRTFYKGCHTKAEVSGGTARIQLTIHADHLFYDDLVDPEPRVAFDLIASADRDGDGEVTQAELAALDLSTQERYQVGGTGIRDLWSFLAYQTGSMGHIDGEGHCSGTERQ